MSYTPTSTRAATWRTLPLKRIKYAYTRVVFYIFVEGFRVSNRRKSNLRLLYPRSNSIKFAIVRYKQIYKIRGPKELRVKRLRGGKDGFTNPHPRTTLKKKKKRSWKRIPIANIYAFVVDGTSSVSTSYELRATSYEHLEKGVAFRG